MFNVSFDYVAPTGQRVLVTKLVATLPGENVFTKARALLGNPRMLRVIRATAAVAQVIVRPENVIALPGGKSAAKLASMAAYNDRRRAARKLAKAA